MAQVTLKVVVDDSQVSALQQKVEKLDNRKINLTAQSNLNEVGKDAGSAAENVEKLNKAEKGFNATAFVGRVVVYRMLYQTIQTVTTAFRSALDTIHKVDDELVTVRKVTNFSVSQMEAVQKKAFETASKYGSAADEYLNAVSAFARAGYKDISADLAELSTKTQIVGDTTAEVANQFLLSVDAAYQYKGSVEALSRVLDGANELDNKYATSIEKIAEGMGIVAPVAAQMHVGVDELAASIGTITAVTQRSGTEAARALRAIFLNIVGDTKTEIDEGVTWTTGEIAGLKDVIRQYATEAYKAAEATGSVIDPMEAIRGLAKSMEEGVLSEQKLMEMVSDIGGKLRTSQLLAIIQNWDMYESMLQDYRNAYGSADKEVENAMDSWTRKANVLKNTWTEFVQRTISAEGMKNFLDLLTTIVGRLDSIPGVLGRITLIVAALRLPSIANTVRNIAASLTTMGAGLTATSGILAGIAVVWGIVSYAIENAKIQHEKEIAAIYEEAASAKESAKNVLDLYVELTNATEGSDAFNKSAKNLADTLKTDIPEGAEEAKRALQELTAAEMKRAADAANTALLTAGSEFTSAVAGARTSDLLGGYIPDSLKSGVMDILAPLRDQPGNSYGYIEISNLEQAQAFRSAMEEIIALRDEYVRQTKDTSVVDNGYFKSVQNFLAETEEAYNTYIEAKQRAIDTGAMEIFQTSISNATVKSKEDLDALIQSWANQKDISEETLAALTELANSYFVFQDAVEGSTAALNENASAADRAKAAKERAEAAAVKFISVLFDENGALTAVGKAALETDSNLASLVKTELEAELAAKQANYSALVAQLAMVGITAETTAQQLWAMARAAAGDSPFAGAIAGATFGAYSGYQALLKSRLSEITGLKAQISAVGSYAPASGKSSSGSGRSGSKSSSSSGTADKRLEALKDRVTLLKSELELMKERGDSEEDQIAKMREIQKALHAEADYLRSIKGNQADINSLSTEWWSIENQITKEKETQAKAIQDALDAQVALNNAMNDRSVRYYNADTGQWEWGANQQNVDSAYSALEKAISAAGFSDMNAWNSYYGVHSALSNFSAAGFNTSSGVLAGLGAGSPIQRGGVNNNYVGGTNNYGNTYQFGNLTFSEQQARTITLYDLAQMSRNLSLYNSVY